MQCHACLSHHHPSAFTPNPCQCEFSHLHALLCIAARCMRARSYVVCSCLCCAQMNGLRFSGHCTLKMRIKLSGIVPAFTIPQQLTRKRIWRGHRMCTVQTRYMHPNLLHCSLLQICISGIQRAWAMCNVCYVCVCVNRNRTHNRGYNIWACCTTCGSGSGFHKSTVSTSESARKPTFNARPLHKMAHTVACVLFPCHGMACGCVCVCARRLCYSRELGRKVQGTSSQTATTSKSNYKTIKLYQAKRMDETKMPSPSTRHFHRSTARRRWRRRIIEPGTTNKTRRAWRLEISWHACHPH